MVLLPDPPVSFGSYPPSDVVFLLTDLTGRVEESTLAERDANIRGGGHYSELLPLEYEPSAEYRDMFDAALARNAELVATAVAVACERVLRLRSGPFVLVSLARAGTPIGVLMRRYLLACRDVDAAHYSISIIRGRGLDQTAVAWLRHHHPGVPLQFVDGWTGKGAIQRELTAACAALGLDDRMAVATDPGWCAAIPGMRDDILVPSACLNATVSGLVSRTVLRADLISAGSFHGAKTYDELGGIDVSNHFVDTIAACFDSNLAASAADQALTSLEAPSWAGWEAVERVGRTFGIDDPNRIKPGIGEATRVLLRRTPWLLLVRGGGGPDIDHLLQLADERGVNVEAYDDMPFVACGLVRA